MVNTMLLKGNRRKMVWLLMFFNLFARMQLVKSQKLLENITKPPEKIPDVVTSFGQSVAIPLMTSFPKTYLLDTIVAELQVSPFSTFPLHSPHTFLQIGGIYNPQDVTASVEKSIRDSITFSLNQLLDKSNACCADINSIFITNVCNYDYLQCRNLIYSTFGNLCGNGDHLNRNHRSSC